MQLTMYTYNLFLKIIDMLNYIKPTTYADFGNIGLIFGGIGTFLLSIVAFNWVEQIKIKGLNKIAFNTIVASINILAICNDMMGGGAPIVESNHLHYLLYKTGRDREKFSKYRRYSKIFFDKDVDDVLSDINKLMIEVRTKVMLTTQQNSGLNLEDIVNKYYYKVSILEKKLKTVMKRYCKII